MANVHGRDWRRNKLPPLSCSPEQTLKNEVSMEKEAEKIYDTDSVSSDDVTVARQFSSAAEERKRAPCYSRQS